MSIEEKLIKLIDDTEQDKTDEASPDDESNRVEKRINDEILRLESLIQEHGLPEENAEKLKLSFQKDLQEIYEKTSESRFRFQESDIGIDINTTFINQMRDVFPNIPKGEIINLFLLNYNIVGNDIVIAKLTNPDLSFSDVKDIVKAGIAFKDVRNLHKAFPETPWGKKKDFLLSRPHLILDGILDAKESFPKLSLEDLEMMTFLSASAGFDRWKKIREMFPGEPFEDLFDVFNFATDSRYQWGENIKKIYPEIGFEGTLQILDSMKDFEGSYGWLQILNIYPDVSLEEFKECIGWKINFEKVKIVHELFPDISWSQMYDFLRDYGYRDLEGLLEVKKDFPNISLEDLRRILDSTYNPQLKYWVDLKLHFPEINIPDILDLINSGVDITPPFLYKKVNNFKILPMLKAAFGEIIYKGDEQALYFDPALGIFSDILEKGFIQDASYEDKMMVARNIYFIGDTNIDQHFVESELKLLILAREQYIDTEVFSGKNIVYAAHGEDISPEDRSYFNIEEKNRFGRNATIDAIRNQGGVFDSSSFFRPEKNSESLSEAKEGVLNSIIYKDSPMTFVFDGHGWNNGIFFSGGEVNSDGDGIETTQTSVHISHKEITKAIIERAKQGKNISEDIFIFNSCRSNNYIRNIYMVLKRHNQSVDSSAHIEYPIMISPTEFNQLSYGWNDSSFGNKFDENILGFGKGEQTTIGRMSQNEDEYRKGSKTSSVTTIFVPRPDGKGMMQIS